MTLYVQILHLHLTCFNGDTGYHWCKLSRNILFLNSHINSYWNFCTWYMYVTNLKRFWCLEF